jgi:hypothetical protein
MPGFALPSVFTTNAEHGVGGPLLGQLLSADRARFSHYVPHKFSLQAFGSVAAQLHCTPRTKTLDAFRIKNSSNAKAGCSGTQQATGSWGCIETLARESLNSASPVRETMRLVSGPVPVPRQVNPPRFSRDTAFAVAQDFPVSRPKILLDFVDRYEFIVPPTRARLDAARFGEFPFSGC